MIHLIADTHFNHYFLTNQNIRQADFDNKLWRALGRLTGKDWLIHLGDVSIDDDHITHVKLNTDCPARHRVLVRGNHDQRGIDWYLDKGWDHVTDGLILNRFGKTILFTHEPVALPPWIDMNIHGHLHAGVHRQTVFEDNQHILISCETDGYKTIPLKHVIVR